MSSLQLVVECGNSKMKGLSPLKPPPAAATAPSLPFSTSFILPISIKGIKSPATLRETRNRGKKSLLLPSLRCGSVPLPSPQVLSSECSWEDYYVDHDYIVVNFYHFVFIKDPEEEVSRHLSFLQGLDIHGRIYLNKQGINAQYSGPPKDALGYMKWLREDHRFSDVLFQISPALGGHAFPRLKLRYKPSLIQLEGGVSHLPLLDPLMRAIPLTPSQWRHRLKSMNGDEVSNQNPIKSFILLDVRNGYEWDIGHFRGAQRPEVDCFRSTSFGLSDSELNNSDPLASVDQEKASILMYCTGGIRCDIYSTILRQRGFRNLFTLKGGISHYLQSEGPADWIGNLFVFDSRLSLPPSSFNPEVTTESSSPQVPLGNSTFARCYICGSQLSELRHRNCANLDCNLLFLCCANCVNDLRGCCCLKCTYATRRRPILPEHQRYKKWHYYRDLNLQST